MTLDDLTKVEAVQIAIDEHLVQVRRELMEHGFSEEDTAYVAACMRWSWARGYCFALGEDHPGQLLRDYGYSLPPRAGANRQEGEDDDRDTDQ